MKQRTKIALLLIGIGTVLIVASLIVMPFVRKNEIEYTHLYGEDLVEKNLHEFNGTYIDINTDILFHYCTEEKVLITSNKKYVLLTCKDKYKNQSNKLVIASSTYDILIKNYTIFGEVKELDSNVKKDLGNIDYYFDFNNINNFYMDTVSVIIRGIIIIVLGVLLLIASYVANLKWTTTLFYICLIPTVLTLIVSLISSIVGISWFWSSDKVYGLEAFYETFVLYTLGIPILIPMHIYNVAYLLGKGINLITKKRD